MIAGAVFVLFFLLAVLCLNAAVQKAMAESGARSIFFANISIALDGGENKVIATARNNFTLFPATVYVVAQLYCSLTYTEDYKEMELVCMTSTDDLDQGHTITTEFSTNGERKYWMGRARYRENGGEWKELTVGPVLYSASGEYLGLS